MYIPNTKIQIKGTIFIQKDFPIIAAESVQWNFDHRNYHFTHVTVVALLIVRNIKMEDDKVNCIHLRFYIDLLHILTFVCLVLVFINLVFQENSNICHIVWCRSPHKWRKTDIYFPPLWRKSKTQELHGGVGVCQLFVY